MLLPRTIRGQITGLIVLAVAIAVLLSFGAGFFMQRAVYSHANLPLPPSILVAKLFAQAQTASEVAEIESSVRDAGLDFRHISDGEARQMMQSARNQLPQAYSGEWNGQVTQGVFAGPGATAIAVLKTGGRIEVRDQRRPPPPLFLFPMAFALIVATICILGVSVYAARSITAPLTSFVAAASAVGRGQGHGQHIREKGPVEIARVASALNEMQGRIRNLLNERTDMLTAISHDLRTPLTRMRLRAERVQTLSEIWLVEGIITDIGHMEQMLGETLSYLREPSNGELMSLIDLPSFLQTMCSDLSDIGQNISYHGPSSLVYLCQPMAISRAIGNILDNACKYGDVVSVALERTPEGLIRIDICDDGPGIHDAHREKVFEPFFKSEPSRRSATDGFGLGLSIARKIVENHGGRIELLDAVPRGLIVRFLLPDRPPNAVSGQEA